MKTLRIDPSLRNVVYMAASKFGNQSDLLFLIEKHRAEVYHMERDRLFSSLAATSNRTHIALLTLFLYILIFMTVYSK